MAAFLHFLSLYYLVATLPPYVLDLGGSSFEVGLVNGVFALTSFAVRPLFGVWMDRVGRRRPFLLAGAGIYVLASAGYVGIRSVPSLLWWRAFHALGLASFSTAAASVAGDLAPARRRGRTMGLFGLAQAGALGVGPGTGRMLQAALGHVGLCLVGAGTALAALACAGTLPRGASEAAGTRGTGPADHAFAGRGATALPAVAQAAASMAYGAIVSFVPLLARERGVGAVGTFFALFALSSLAIRPPAGLAYDRQGVAAVLGPAFGGVALALALLAAATTSAPFLVAAVLAGLGIGAAHTTLVARVVDRAPSETRATALAGFIACWELGFGGGTVVTGWLADAAGLPATFLALAVLPLAALGLLPWLRR